MTVLEAFVAQSERLNATKLLSSSPVVHARDGKPLTAHGAKLLGVPWPRR